MTRTLRHRGPDGEGYFVRANVALGHQRLAVVDLRTGDQPMSSDDGLLTVIFNGEIYNHIELRADLAARGHRFRTTSDTEVLLAAYREWGACCVERFNGMWAFALWDECKRRLFCSRDRLGEKPFYYALANGTFVFGSEIKALFEYGVPRQMNSEVLDAYLCFGYVPGPSTFFQGIHKLQPGHSLEVWDGHVHQARYWELSIADEQEARDDESGILEEFADLFQSAVKIRMRSDVPLGAFLSGGLDSSCIVAAMSELSSAPIRTCTIGFENPAFDERRLARLVAEAFGTQHTERVVLPVDSREMLSKLAWHYDEPFGDSSALPTYVVSQVARERVKVALTGDGGDEVTAGYTIFQGEKVAALYHWLPLRWGTGAALSLVRGTRRVVPRTLKRKVLRVENVLGSSAMDFVDRLESKQIGFTRTERNKLIRCRSVRPAREFIVEAIKPVADKGNFTKLGYWLTKVALPDDMLCKVDRASMAHGLETRTPFLDHRIVELLAKVSIRVKLDGFRRKEVLRKTIGRRLPAELLRAPKRGFSVPLCEWFQGDTVEGLVRNAFQLQVSEMLRRETIDDILQEHRTGNRDAGNAIWTLGMLAAHLN